MEVKINREVRDYTESMFFGLSLRQLVFSLLAVKMFVRFALAKGVITYGMELMLALLEIVQSIVSSIMNAAASVSQSRRGGHDNTSAVRRLFFFCRRPADFLYYQRKSR